ncbi:MAG TPA: helix-hairpin-helix domain-containing protein [Candidatus Eremiobacteraceae bacterium]|nr:helix-hairpin-helix domain-containing protein [Candidatus Eremiobacteraceae bacterium]
MDRSPLVKIVAASAAAVALIALGALLPKPPVASPPSLAPVDSLTAPGVAPSADPESGQQSAEPAGPLHVYVCGAVRKAGVYVMPAGSRVVDALDKAGGASGNSDLEQLNLAEPLSDGMKVEVPVKGQTLAESVGSIGITRPDSFSGARGARSVRHSASRGGSHKLSAGQTLDINTASESELAQLPGVGPSLARRIVEYRTANGPFQMPDDLQNVSGIGANKFAKMEPFVRI